VVEVDTTSPPWLSLFPSVPVGTGKEVAGGAGGEVLLIESGRGALLFFPFSLLPPFEEESGRDVEDTAGVETVELRTPEETLVGRTVEDVESTGGVEEDETPLAFCPPSATVI
jgi:hypothetical protein